jgi:hypothetical protein
MSLIWFARTAVSLADALSPRRIVFELEAPSMSEAIRQFIKRIPSNELPADAQTIIRAVQQREQAMPTYLGKGLQSRTGGWMALASQSSLSPAPPKVCRWKTRTSGRN